MFNQILESEYINHIEKWQEVIMREGGLEICDSITGKPLYTIKASDLEGSFDEW